MLGGAERMALERIAAEQSYTKAQTIFREGDAGNGVYVVKQGCVEICSTAVDSEHRVFAEVPPGEMFGEMAVLEVKPRSATARAREDCVVYFIPRDELLLQIERSPLLALELLRAISRRLRDLNQRYIQDVLQAERLAVVGRFARSIIHDIKNPLNIISLSAELSCLDTSTPQTRQRSSTTIRKQVERINDLVGDILDFTQGASKDLILGIVDYDAFLQKLVDDLQPELEMRNARLEVGPVPTVRPRFDPRRLRRVFNNLLHNATDAMPGGGVIRVRVANQENAVLTEIEDSGPGIAPEIAGKLFEAFATFGKAHGTGLGLSICKKIIEDHGGRIWTRSEPGHGAIFCFTLPL